MKKTPTHSGEPWKPQEAALNKYLKQDTPTPLIAYRLGRSTAAVQKHVNDTGGSTKPINKSPYNRHTK